MDYEIFFGLNEQAFQEEYSAKFFYKSVEINKILKILKADDRPKITFIEGVENIGKTSFLKKLYSEFSEKTKAIVIYNENLTLEEFLQESLNTFSLNYSDAPEEVLLGFFQNAVNDFIAEGYKIVLAVDNVHKCSLEKIEDFLNLINLEENWQDNFHLILVGNDLSYIKLIEEVEIKIFNLNALNHKELKNYLEFRLKVAGAKKNYFSSQAIESLMKYSKGVLKEVNVLAEKALMAAWADGKKEILSSHIDLAKNSLLNPLAINKQIDRITSNENTVKKKINTITWKRKQNKKFKIKKIIPIAFLLFVICGIYFIFSDNGTELEPVNEEIVTSEPAVNPNENSNLSPAADTSNLTEEEALWATLPSPPGHILKLPYSFFTLVVDADTGIGHLWQMGNKEIGLKAEIIVPGFSSPGLYLIGKPEKNVPLIFHYPPVKEFPNKAVLDLWPKVSGLMPQNNLAILVAPKKNLVKKQDPELAKLFEGYIATWVEGQKEKSSDLFASLYASSFQFFELGKAPQTIRLDEYKKALESEFLNSNKISVLISEPLILKDPIRDNTVWIIFNVKYESDLRNDMGIRVLVFEKKILSSSSWAIIAELWLQEAIVR